MSVSSRQNERCRRVLVCVVMCAIVLAGGSDIVNAQRRGAVRRSSQPRVARGAVARVSPGTTEARFVRLRSDYLRGYFSFHPTAQMIFDANATGALETRSAAALTGEVRRLRSALAGINNFQRGESRLSNDARDTLVALEAHARRELFALEDARVWQRDPTLYTTLIGRHVDTLFGRGGMDAARRHALFLQREDDIERLLNEARANLTEVSRPAAEAGAEDARGCAAYFREVVPQAFERAGGGRLSAAARAGFADANNRLIASLDAHARWLERELMPRAVSAPPLSSENYTRKLTLELGRETDARAIRREAESQLRQVQSEMRELAEEVAPQRGMAAALALIRRERPTANGLVGEVRLELDRLDAFLQAQNLIALPPSASNFTIAETPSYLRAVETAMLDDNRFYITPPAPESDTARPREYLGYLNRYALPFLLMKHAAAPRYLTETFASSRLAFAPKMNIGTNIETDDAMNDVVNTATGDTTNQVSSFASAVRLPSGFISEFFERAWGEFGVRLLVERDFGGGNPKFRFAALHLRQLALCRVIADVRVHTEGMTYTDAVDFLVREANVPATVAVREGRWLWLHPSLAVADTTGANIINRLFVTNATDEKREARFAQIARPLMHGAALPLETATARAGRISSTDGDTENLSNGAARAATVRPQANDATKTDVDFTVIATGTMSEYEGERAIELITNEEAWRRTWSQTLGVRANASLPDINFATRSLVVVRQGVRPTAGYSISVRAVNRDERGLLITIDEQTPAPGGLGAQVITSPFVVISVPRATGVDSVRFDAPESKSKATGASIMSEEVLRPPVRRRTPPRHPRRRSPRP